MDLNKRYTEEFKIETIKQVIALEHSAADVANRRGILSATLGKVRFHQTIL